MKGDCYKQTATSADMHSHDLEDIISDFDVRCTYLPFISASPSWLDRLLL